MFHANAGNLGHRLPLARVFYDKMRCNVLMLSYRGYGKSEGRPSEAGLRMDAQASLDFILSHPLLRHTKIILYGQSIGGAVTIDLASRNPSAVHGVIVENTFLSVPDLIPTVMPYLASVSFLCHQHWRNSDAIRKIPTTTPMLMLSGLRDELVPPMHMWRLWEIVTSGLDGEEEEEEKGGDNGDDPGDEKHPPVRYRKVKKGTRWWMELTDGEHNNTCNNREYWAEVARFVHRFSKLQ